MRAFRKLQARTLSEWLEIATRKLAAPAKERITAEIEAHYSEAVAEHRDNGSVESDAQRAALAELGDAKAAARRFRQRHLTEWEASVAEHSNKSARSIFNLVLGYFIFGEFAFSQLPLKGNALSHYPHPFLGMSVEFLVLTAAPTIRFIAARRGGINSRVRLLVLIQSLSGPTPGILLHGLFMPHLFVGDQWLKILVCPMLMIRMLILVRVWSQLGKVGAIQCQAIPPDLAKS